MGLYFASPETFTWNFQPKKTFSKKGNLGDKKSNTNVKKKNKK